MIRSQQSKQKDINSVLRSGYWRIFWWTFPFLALVGMFFGWAGILTAFIVSLILCVFVDWASGGLGHWASLLYRGRFGSWSVREQVEGMVNVARQQKGHRNYSKALLVINRVLRRDPDNSEGLYLKAEILWEGYRNQNEAEACLSKLLQHVSEDDTLYQWASTLYATMLNASIEPDTPPKRKEKIR